MTSGIHQVLGESVVLVMPGSELRLWDAYKGIVRRGFLLEWMVPVDCAEYNTNSGECRYKAILNEFRCFCPDGRMHPATCHEFAPVQRSILISFLG